MPVDDRSVTVSVSALREFCIDVLSSVGTPLGHAETTADVLSLTDSWGTFTHGVKLLGGYVQRLKAGGLRTDVDPIVANRGPAWAVVDGQSVLGQVTATLAMRTAIEIAEESGLGYVTVRNSCHFGAAGAYSSLAAEANMIGMSMANDVPSVAAPGSRRAVTGTNPFSYAVPAASHPPILLDCAMSTVAGGKVYASHQLGKAIPDNWIIDDDGKPTTDGSLYPHHASLAPMTGHKGYGLALMIESLAGLVSGAKMTWQVGNWMFGDLTQPTGHGGAFLAVNIGAMQPADEFLKRVDALIDEIHDAPTADGVEQVFVPGEMEWTRREKALVSGIDLPGDVVASVRSLANDVGIKPEWLND